MEEEHKVVLSGKAGEVDYLHSLHGQIGKPKANVFTRFTRQMFIESKKAKQLDSQDKGLNQTNIYQIDLALCFVMIEN